MNSPYSDLFDFLSILPGIRDNAERKALLAFSGYAFVGLYLDFSASQVDFVQALVAAVCGRGQQFTLQFLTGLQNAPQVGNAYQDQFAALQKKLTDLTPAEWKTLFPGAASEVVAASTLPDSDMLAMSIVSDVLLPFYTLGAAQLQSQCGINAVDLARQVVDVLESDVGIRSYLTMFKAAPTATEAGFVAALKGIVTADADLARGLADIMLAERGAGTAELATLVQISQDIREVSGDVVGALVGQELVGRLTIKQKIDTVSSGGTVVGAVIGVPGPVRIGGQTVEGDYVAGDKVDGDKIEGDQIKTGDIVDSSGVAIGRDASATSE